MCGHVASLTMDVTEALEAISYRGVRSKVMGQMGHARLPIVGVGPQNDQPVLQGKWIISFVGEVLDFREIDPGAECDLAVVVDSFVEGGERLRRADGFWSVIAISENLDVMTFFVDYLAQKPLYYRDDTLSVASELRALLHLGNVHLDKIYLASVVKWGYCPEPWRTPYQEIRKVLPGQRITMNRWDGVVSRETVDPLFPRTLSFSDMRAEIEAAVRRRVTSSDVPVAALVSGGLDSAITYTLAKRYGDVRPYHVENGELESAVKVLGDGEWGLVTLDEVSDEQCLDYMQEPIDLGSLAPQVALSDAIAGKATVCLTGDGADEFWGGYGRSSRYDSQASDVWHELVMWHLPRLDRVMMRNRIEVRSPFLARRVAEAALAVPWAGFRQDKELLRNLFQDDLPSGVADRAKRPLRTARVSQDREARSRELVDCFTMRNT